MHLFTCAREKMKKNKNGLKNMISRKWRESSQSQNLNLDARKSRLF